MNFVDRDVNDDELMDDELLDTIFKDVRDNLIAHVRATASPARALVAMMGTSEQRDSQRPAQPDDLSSNTTQLAVRQLTAVIEVRGHASEVDRRLSEIMSLSDDLAADLDRDLDEHSHLPIAARSARAFAQSGDRRLVQLLSRARDLVVEIAHDLRRVQELDRALTIDRDVKVIRELASDVPSDQMIHDIRELDCAYASRRQSDIGEHIKEADELSQEADELSASLDEARRLSDLRERWKNLDHRDARELAHAMDGVLKRVDKLANALLYRVHTLEVDVKYADLSDVRIPHVGGLTGVLWNECTVWPAEVADEVADASRVVTDGVRQVRPDGHRPAISLGRHSAERLPVHAGR